MSATYSIFTSPDHAPIKDHLPTLIVTPNARPDHILYTYQHHNLNTENVIVSSAGVRVATLKPSRGIAALVGRTYAAAGSGSIRCEGGRSINWTLLNTGKQQAIYKVRVSGTDILQVSKPNTHADFWTLFYFAPGGHMLPPKRVEFGRISRDKLGATVVSIFGRNTDERGIWSVIGEENEDAVEWIVLSAALVVLDGEIVTVAEKSGYDLSGQTRVSASAGAVRTREGELAAQRKEANGGAAAHAAGTRGASGGAALAAGAAMSAAAGRVPKNGQQIERQERARIEQARQEQARQEQARQEQARQEQARQEQARQEQARQEQARQEQARQEQARQEQARQEHARQQHARQEELRQRQAAAQQQELLRQRQLAEQQEHLRQRQLAEYQQEQMRQEQMRQRQMAEQQEQERNMKLEQQEQLRQRQLAEQRLQMSSQAELARKDERAYQERAYQERLRQEQVRGQRGQDPHIMPTVPVERPTQHMLASEQQKRQMMEQRQRQLSREREEQRHFGYPSQEYGEQQRLGQTSREQQEYLMQRQALEQQEQMRQRQIAQQQQTQMQQMHRNQITQEQLRQQQAQHIRNNAMRPAQAPMGPQAGRPMMKQHSSSEKRSSLIQRSGTPASQSSHGTSVNSSPSKKKFYQTQDNYYGSVATAATEGAPAKPSFSLFKKR